MSFKRVESVITSVSQEKITLTAEVSKDTELYQAFDEFEDEYPSRAAAIRAAIREGTADEPSTQTAGAVESFFIAAGYISLFFAFFGLVVGAYATAAVALFMPGVAVAPVAGVSGLLVVTWVTVAAVVFGVRSTSLGARLGVPAT